jgi:subtilisin family serine protease
MRNTLILIGLFIASITFAQSDAKSDLNSFNKKNINWYNKDLKKDKIAGASVDKLYSELLSDKTPKKSIIVAVIDGGVDIKHKDLEGRIWKNTKEIPDNGIDDDKNGYIDDIYGWNFIGNSEGKNINRAPLEKTRMLRQMEAKFKDKNASDFSGDNLKEFKLYEKVSKSYYHEFTDDNLQYLNLKDFIDNIDAAKDILTDYFKKDDYSPSDVNNINTTDESLLSAKNFMVYIYKNKIDIEDIKSYFDYLDETVNYNLNKDFFPRKDIIGDDLNNFTYTNYGNKNVTGPRAEHGSFGAGIIAAVRNNGLGVDGVADSVKIMAIRVVPDGDEYDKDVALAIRYAVDNGAKVINMSFGKDFSPHADKVWDALKYASDNNVLLVHAAGNESENNDTIVHYPTKELKGKGTVENFLAIGANEIKANKNLPATFSNYGKTTVDLFAPGYEVISIAPKDKYSVASGTSFSAPVTTGVAALLWSYFPEKSAAQIKEAMMKSVSDLGNKKVYIPGGRGSKTKVLFSDLSVTGGVVNAYLAYLYLRDN